MKTLKRLKLKNLLSFGNPGIDLELRSLNVLIGANGSGKSNLIGAISLLKSATTNFSNVLTYGETAVDWLRKDDNGKVLPAEIYAYWDRPDFRVGILHQIILKESKYRFYVADELIEDEKPAVPGAKQPRKYFFYKNRRAYLNILGQDGKTTKKGFEQEDINPEKSILAQRSDPDHYPELYKWGETLKKIQLLCEWQFGGKNVARFAQSSNLPNEYLMEGGENLPLMINRLKFDHVAKRTLMEGLKDFYPWIEDIDLIMYAGKAQICFQEKGGMFTPATRLSDGTMRWLALLAILLNPAPPPLVCIEEPELGLHPDVIPKLADLLVEASQRMQIVITTHSDILVDALSPHPESIIVVDKDENGSKFTRLNADDLKDWLNRYSLGELWRKGEIGGNRW